jgi:hypothetical protein
MTTSEMLERERERKRQKREQRSTNMLRLKRIYARLGVGKTKFDEDYRYHDDSDPFLPGTEIPRLKLAHIGKRAVAGFEDEVDALVEALRQHRDQQAEA